MVQLYPNKYNFEDVDYAAMNSYMTFLVNRFAPMKVEELLRDYAEAVIPHKILPFLFIEFPISFSK
jgi:hypothetical protein